MQYKTSGGGGPPILIEALYKASEDSEEMRGGGKKKKQKNFNNRRQEHPHEGPGPFSNNNNPYGDHDQHQEQNSPITSAVMNSAIFSDHFKHLYTKVQSFGQSLRMTPRRGRPPPHPHSQPFR